MDALPPPPPQPIRPAPAYVYGPGDIYARGDRERELCAKASQFDWLHLTIGAAATAGSVWINGETKFVSSEFVRMIGPATIGLSVGWLIGSLPLALPHCSETGVRFAGREGDVGDSFFLATSLALGSAALASITMAISTGAQPQEWSDRERATRVVTSSVFAFGGALLPRLIPPRNYRAAQELRKLRFETRGDGAFIGYSTTF